jgi:membrane-associated phospholipid phosphatase
MRSTTPPTPRCNKMIARLRWIARHDDEGGTSLTTFLAQLTRDVLAADLAGFWFVNSHHVRALDSVFLALTQLGNGWVAIPLLLAVVGFRYRSRAAAPLMACVLTFALSGLSNNTCKRFIEWRRPTEYFARQDPTGALASRLHVVGERLGGRTFPSGHTNTAFATAVLLVGLLGRRWWPALLVAGGVGWSRMYLGVHFPSDVIVGALIGSGFAMAVATAMRRARKREKLPAAASEQR